MPFADELIGADVAQNLYRAIRAAAPDADLTELAAAADSLPPLSLRERADLLRDALLAGLPGGYASLARTIRSAARSSGFEGWLIWPVTNAVAVRAVEDDTPEAFDGAMALLAELTGRLTSEFAIRSLLRHDLDRAIGIITDWTGSGDAAVRRLASEGTRPYLPWAVRVPQLAVRPGVTIPLLDALYRDESEHVRRSVANHLNDLSRDEADLVVETATRWLAAPDTNTGWVVRHGLRTLVKRGHPGAMALLGFGPASLDVDGPVVGNNTVPIGESIRFRARIRNAGDEPAKLAIDYVVHHMKANGSQTGKTFKLTTRVLSPGETADIEREHSFREITTRRYHPGAHAIELLVNGVSVGRADFELLG
ncbi:DNA alkylation repair protein [Brooklawnia cerclae]|uniref:3-methyladenine DNA glycosylase AlkC n=1 Tax=Brooklawnia cerclae TaxID=349934 RepID=A0ABX0SJF4_9ACTN|nr:DNA alkylation repair protein [Brooklawnia cerclae]NIH58527.1 3-methyladenine DNA glycosylase AlkC [Brooklawnia cerclae]